MEAMLCSATLQVWWYGVTIKVTCALDFQGSGSRCAPTASTLYFPDGLESAEILMGFDRYIKQRGELSSSGQSFAV